MLIKLLATKHSTRYSTRLAGKPSRVIHIRNIQNDSSEADVIQLGLPFGRVTNVLVLKGKNQAFLEMADEVSAAAMVACFNTNPPQVRGRTVYVQFSNHRELKIDQSHSVIVSIEIICLSLKLTGVFLFCFLFGLISASKSKINNISNVLRVCFHGVYRMLRLHYKIKTSKWHRPHPVHHCQYLALIPYRMASIKRYQLVDQIQFYVW